MGSQHSRSAQAEPAGGKTVSQPLKILLLGASRSGKSTVLDMFTNFLRGSRQGLPKVEDLLIATPSFFFPRPTEPENTTPYDATRGAVPCRSSGVAIRLLM